MQGVFFITMAAGLITGAASAQSLSGQSLADQSITPPIAQGSFLSPEAPAAPKLDIDPSLIGLAPKAEGAAVATASVSVLAEKAAAARTARKSTLYKQLMELNGTSKNVRLILANTKAAVRLVILERKGGQPLSASESIKFSQIADRVLKDAEAEIIDQIATAQSASFSEDEIASLITANSSAAAAKYNAGKFANNETNAQQIQGYMVDAVVKIIRSFQQSISG